MANYRLQLLHASDWEAGLDALDRAANMAAIFDRLEDLEPNSITLSSGDGWLPGPFFSASNDPGIQDNLEAVYNAFFRLAPGAGYADLRASPGRADITIQNIIGVQASAFGNHEFDAGTTEVASIINADYRAAGLGNDRWVGAQFPYLSANLNFYGDANLAPLYTGVASNAVLTAYFNGVPGASVAPIQEWTEFQSGPTQSLANDINKKIAPATIITENGEKIGIVGATTQIVETISSPGGVDVIDPEANDMTALAAILQPTIDAVVAQGVNKVILLTHLQQIAFEKDLATKLKGVDIIVAGGSNTLQADANDDLRPGDAADETYPFQTTDADGNPILVVNTEGEFYNVGRLVVEFDDAGELVLSTLDPAVNGAYVTTDAKVAELYGGDANAAFADGTKGSLVRRIIEGSDNAAGVNDGVREVINGQDGNLFGKTTVYLEGRRSETRTEETNLGSLSADANLWYARRTDATVEVSIKNGGGIRDSIGRIETPSGATSPNELPPAGNPSAGKEEGEVSQLDLSNSLRFNNGLSLLTIAAAELLQVLEHGVAATAPGATPGQFAQVGGVTYSFDATRPAGDRIISAAVIDEDDQVTRVLAQNGALVGPADTPIRIVTLNFLAGGGDSYPFPMLGDNRVNLYQGTDAAPDPNGPKTGPAAFAPDGTEQDAFAEYLREFFSETPFATPDTEPAGDLRIQNLAARTDAVFARGLDVEGTAAAETITGGALGDDLFGREGADGLVGLAGSDLLDGGAGLDTLDGGDGIDIAAALAASATAFIDLRDAPGFFLDGVVYSTIISIEGAAGGSATDYLLGDGGANLFRGNGGADALLGRGGNDTLEGGAGDDFLMGGDAYDPAATGSGNDSIDGGAGVDVIFAMDGGDTVRGGADADFVLSGAGSDAVEGGSGGDFLFAGAAFDFDQANAGNDTIEGGDGNDFIVGGQGLDSLDGGSGDDIVYGGAGGDALKGGAGSDFVLGDGGGDTVSGGAGFDIVTGGGGDDTFVFNRGDSADLVTDFALGDGDKLRLDAALGVASFADFQSRLVGFTFEGVDHSALYFAGSGDAIVVAGLRPDQWTAVNLEIA